MVWGNGGCGVNSTDFSGFLTTIVSHGVLVVGTVPQESAAQRQETTDDMRAAIDWAEKENVRARRSRRLPSRSRGPAPGLYSAPGLSWRLLSILDRRDP